jgi:hypothetical protein
VEAVSNSRRNESSQFSLPQRLLVLLAGLILLALLAVAAWLPPDPRGLGTHQGLGLPPCSFRQMTGLRCPSCGMTTSWSHLMRGQLLSSVKANASGMLLGVLAILLTPWVLGSAIRGRWLIRPLDEQVTLVVVIGILVITVGEWCLRLWLDGVSG